jgi:hypothetical protein
MCRLANGNAVVQRLAESTDITGNSAENAERINHKTPKPMKSKQANKGIAKNPPLKIS